MGNAILEKSYRLALCTVKLCTGPYGRKLALMRKQLFLSGTSCGANVEESQAAEGHKDFVHKIGVATKEAHEASYWLRLARDSGLLPESVISEPLALSEEVKRLGHSIIGTTRSRLASLAAFLLTVSLATLISYFLFHI